MTKFSNEAIAACIEAGIMKGGRGPRPAGANEWMENWQNANNVTFIAPLSEEKLFPEGYKPSKKAKEVCKVPAQKGRIATSLLNACFKWDTDNNNVGVIDIDDEEVKPLYPDGFKPSSAVCQAIGKGKGRWSREQLNKAWLYLQENPEIEVVKENKEVTVDTHYNRPFSIPDMYLDDKIGNPLFIKWQNAPNVTKEAEALKAIGVIYQETNKLPKGMNLADLMVSDDEGFWDFSNGEGKYMRTKPFASVR
jgi:hypothetical protein